MAVVLLAIMIPIYIIFGAEKARFAMMAIMGVFIALGFMVDKVAGNSVEAINSMVAKLETLSDIQLILIGLVSMVVLFTISVLITVKVLERKEY